MVQYQVKLNKNIMAAKFNYSKSLKELEEILSKLESGDVPIDKLNKMVEKSKELIIGCQDHLRVIENKVNDILED